ncbi:ATP-binding protein [Streptomyces parvulus]|uniref:ATP-binding protein n=1 Tax=Streptomyces parvulus TaxID=146923 RepID=UPI0033FD130E
MDSHHGDLTRTPPEGVAPLGPPVPGKSPPPMTAGEARDTVRHLLDGHYAARGGPSGSEVADALLVTSELVTNANRHGGGLTAFSAHVVHGELMLQITDRSPLSPHVLEAERSTPGGFGWALASRLCRTLYVRPLPDGSGKTIVACLPL